MPSIAWQPGRDGKAGMKTKTTNLHKAVPVMEVARHKQSTDKQESHRQRCCSRCLKAGARHSFVMVNLVVLLLLLRRQRQPQRPWYRQMTLLTSRPSRRRVDYVMRHEMLGRRRCCCVGERERRSQVGGKEESSGNLGDLEFK
jgi:hypothetical protein